MVSCGGWEAPPPNQHFWSCPYKLLASLAPRKDAVSKAGSSRVRTETTAGKGKHDRAVTM